MSAEARMADMANWSPLERLQQASATRPAHGISVNADDFMWMGAVEVDGVRVELYKHIDTRRYLNLDDGGHAYRYFGGEYSRLALPTAMLHAYS